MTNEQFQHNCCVFVWWFFFRCVYVTKVFFCFIPCYLGLNWWSVFVLWHLLFLMLLGHVFFSVWLVHSIWRFVHFDKAAELTWQPVNDGFRLLCSFIMPAECLYIIWRHKFILFFFFNVIIFGYEQMNWFVFITNEINRK